MLLVVLLVLSFILCFIYFKRNNNNPHIIKKISPAFLRTEKKIFEMKLPKSKVLDVTVIKNISDKEIEEENINYKYDQLFKIKIKYIRNTKIKSISYLCAQYKDIWMGPSKAELEKLDKSAEILEEEFRSKAGQTAK